MKSRTASSKQLVSRFVVWAILLSVGLALPQFGYSQKPKTQKELEKERLKLEKEIQTYQKLVTETRASREKSLNELHLINRQVYLREQMLSGIEKELGQIDREIDITGKTIISLEQDLKIIQEQYAQLAIAAYKAMMNKPNTFYIMSSKNVKEGVDRMKYFREFKKAQEAQVEFIKRTKAFLDIKRRELEEKKVTKQEVKQVQTAEKAKLATLKEDQKKLYEELKEKETEYAQGLEKKKGELVQMNNMIAAAIQREIEEQKRREKERLEKEAALAAANKANNPTTNHTPEPPVVVDRILPLTKSFQENKGNFPWPLPMPNGVITTKFGRQKLGTSNVEVNMNGVDITTTEGQPIRSVYEGEVLEVMSVPGYGKMVILSHGNYYTVYAHMETAIVGKGQKIKMLDQLGSAKTDARTGETKVHFQVFYDKTPLNPEEWLAEKK